MIYIYYKLLLQYDIETEQEKTHFQQCETLWTKLIKFEASLALR